MNNHENDKSENRNADNVTLAKDNTVEKFEFLGEESLDKINLRERISLKTERQNFIDWLRESGKNPKKSIGYGESSIENFARRLHQIQKWVWEKEGFFMSTLPERYADEFVEDLNADKITKEDGEPYAEASKRKFNDVLKAYYRWKSDSKDYSPWQPPIQFWDNGPTEKIDFFTLREIQQLQSAALNYQCPPTYDNLTPEERDAWKVIISQSEGIPKSDVTPNHFKKLQRQWKIPSLIWTTVDTGLRPCEIERFRTDWLRLQKNEIHIPKQYSAKNDEAWSIAIRDETAKYLQKWLMQRAELPAYSNTDKLWLNQHQNSYSSRNLNYMLRNLLNDAGIDGTNRKIVWYSFRHTLGEHLYDESSQVTTATQLRHKDISSVQNYARPVPDRIRNYLDSIYV